MEHLPCVERDTGEAPDAAVIWLHGLGADGHDFEPIVPALRLPEALALRFVFPHAPAIPVTINNGMTMPAWYDILSMDLDRHVDVTQLRASADAVEALLERERERGIAAERIVLAGFSQGGAVAYELALRYPRRLAGLMALSSYFATRESIELAPANADLPALVCHGTRDPIVPEALGRASHEALLALGHPSEYHSYPMEHAVCGEEIAAISAWLQRVLGSP